MVGTVTDHSVSLQRDAERLAFLRDAGWADSAITALLGDASTRRYFRLARGTSNAMLMDQPKGAETPPCPADASAAERQALGYNAQARLAGPDCARFVANADYLRALGLSAPEIFALDAAQGFVLLEYLGDELYADALTNGGDETQLYAAAADVLAQIHARPAPAMLGPDTPFHRYDRIAFLAETDLFLDWYIPMAFGRDVTADERAEFRTLWSDALDALPDVSPVYVHRDYHAQNLIWLPARHGAARVGLIDFQDSVAGNNSYDLISLLEDARRDVAPELQTVMVNHYLSAMREAGHTIDKEAFNSAAAVFAAQRNTKIIGIFARLFRRDGKPRYLSHLPRVWRYLERDLAHPALASLKAWYDRTISQDIRFVSLADRRA